MNNAKGAVGRPARPTYWRTDTRPVTSAASLTVSPSTSLTSIPGSSRSLLTNVPFVEFSSLMVACPPSSTVISACRRDTLSHCSNAAATSDSAGSRPSMTDVPAGTSTLPAGKVIRSTADEIRRPALLPDKAFWATVIGGGGSSADRTLVRLVPHVQQMRASEAISVVQFGIVRVIFTAGSSLDIGATSGPPVCLVMLAIYAC